MADNHSNLDRKEQQRAQDDTSQVREFCDQINTGDYDLDECKLILAQIYKYIIDLQQIEPKFAIENELVFKQALIELEQLKDAIDQEGTEGIDMARKLKGTMTLLEWHWRKK